MLKIRRSRDRLIFNMGIPYLGKTVFILRRGPGLIWIQFKMVTRCAHPHKFIMNFETCIRPPWSCNLYVRWQVYVLLGDHNARIQRNCLQNNPANTGTHMFTVAIGNRPILEPYQLPLIHNCSWDLRNGNMFGTAWSSNRSANIYIYIYIYIYIFIYIIKKALWLGLSATSIGHMHLSFPADWFYSRTVYPVKRALGRMPDFRLLSINWNCTYMAS